MEKQAKKKGWWLLAILALALAMLPVTGGNAWAETVTLDENWRDPNYVKYEQIGSTNNVKITSYTGSAGNLTIPKEVTSGTTTYTVMEIGSEAFAQFAFREKLTSITLPESVTKIDKEAFFQCENLTTVEFSGVSGLTEIGESAFAECEKLTSVTLPESLTTIGNRAFRYCPNLTSVTLPGKLTTIGDSAFALTGLTNVTVPDSVTQIDASAFSGCKSLTSIKLPDSLTNIGGWTFNGCTSLTSIDLPNSLIDIGEYAFYQCGLTSVTLPGNVKTIGENAFEECTGLTKIDLSATQVTSISENAFKGCTNLANITLPKDVTSIGGYAFYGCTGLKSIDLPDGLTKIGSNAFNGCIGLTSVTLPEKLTTINNYAFAGCENLTEINLSATDVETIGQFAFAGCGLTSVTLPDSVETIGALAFYECKGLTEIDLSDTDVKTIGGWTFEGCTSLKSITLPEGVTTIDNYAFNGCTSLESITLPKGVTNIGNSAFNGCTELRVNITSDGNLPTIGTDAFSGVGQVACTNPDLIDDELASKLGIDSSAVSQAYDLSEVTIAAIPSQIYVGERVEPTDVTLTATSAEDVKITFEQGTDYTLDYGENELTGKGTVIITPTAKGKLCGSPRTVTFDIYRVHFRNGGSESEGAKLPTAGMVDGLTLTLPSPDEFEFAAPEGQRFKHWKIMPPLSSGIVYMNPRDKYDVTTEIVSIMAVWEEIPTYKVTFDNNGGSGTKEPVEVTEGEKYQLPGSDCFTAPEGMEFQNWLVSTVNSSADKNPGETITVTSETTVKAIWKDKSGGDEEEDPGDTEDPGEEEDPGEDDTEKPGEEENPGDDDTEKPGEEENPGGDEDPGDTEKPGQPTTPDKYYTITFDTYGGTLVNITGNKEYVIWGKTYKMPSATKSGYKFQHWAIGAEDSSNTVKANEVYTFTADTTVYAIWQYSGGNSRPSSSGSGGGTTTPVKPEKPGTTNPGTPGTSSNTVTAANINNVFADVQNNAWYAEAIAYVYNKGIMNGIGNGQFEPNASTTRAMLVTMLHRLEKEPGAGAINFGDVASGQWYSQAIAWAAANGIVKGYSDTQFAPNDEITREQLAMILYRYAQFKGLDVTAKGNLSGFSDSQNVSDWAKEAMEWAVGAGIISGNDNGTIAPTANATRAEVAMMLMRFLVNT